MNSSRLTDPQLERRLGFTLASIFGIEEHWFHILLPFFHVSQLTPPLRGGSSNSAVVAALVMSIIPAHIMRSVGGGYDNESLAVTAMCLTFFVWCRALRNRASWWIGALAGLAYVYMVAAWGGYTFVLNMVGVHAAILVIVGGEAVHPPPFIYL